MYGRCSAGSLAKQAKRAQRALRAPCYYVRPRRGLVSCRGYVTFDFSCRGVFSGEPSSFRFEMSGTAWHWPEAQQLRGFAAVRWAASFGPYGRLSAFRFKQPDPVPRKPLRPASASALVRAGPLMSLRWRSRLHIHWPLWSDLFAFVDFVHPAGLGGSPRVQQAKCASEPGENWPFAGVLIFSEFFVFKIITLLFAHALSASLTVSAYGRAIVHKYAAYVYWLVKGIEVF